MRFIRICFVHVVSLVAMCSLGVPAVAETALSAKLTNIDIDNFGRVNVTYFRGALPDDDDYPHLAAPGVKTIVDLTESDGDADEPRMVKTTGMTLVDIPMTTHEPPCVGGRHRIGVMTAVYRMTQKGLTADQAFQEMKQYKFGADFLHQEFKKFVYTFSQEQLRLRQTRLCQFEGIDGGTGELSVAVRIPTRRTDIKL